MADANADDEREASPTGKTMGKRAATEPQFGRIAAVFKGLTAMTREFEKCPRGSRVTERLIYGAMVCVVIVTYIKFGHG